MELLVRLIRLELATAWLDLNCVENLKMAPQPGLEPGTLRLTD
jgi:hypothetical protein